MGIFESIQFIIKIALATIYAMVIIYLFSYLVTSGILQAKQNFLNQLIKKQKNGKKEKETK